MEKYSYKDFALNKSFDLGTVTLSEQEIIDYAKLNDPLEIHTNKEVAEKMREIRLAETNQNSDFLRLHLQRIIVISAVIDTGSKIKVWSLGEHDSNEKELIQRFFDGIEKYSPQLVSWNGGGFDLPSATRFSACGATGRFMPFPQ